MKLIKIPQKKKKINEKKKKKKIYVITNNILKFTKKNSIDHIIFINKFITVFNNYHYLKNEK